MQINEFVFQSSLQVDLKKKKCNQIKNLNSSIRNLSIDILYIFEL